MVREKTETPLSSGDSRIPGGGVALLLLLPGQVRGNKYAHA